MCDLNWCPVCEKTIPLDSSLYCSSNCLKQDAFSHSPLVEFHSSSLHDFFMSPYRNYGMLSERSLVKRREQAPRLSLMLSLPKRMEISPPLQKDTLDYTKPIHWTRRVLLTPKQINLNRLALPFL
ncbi:hypothetical protein BDF14DRAFT_1751697 [Spinellus fusiger]|nr:hypothetical protein BDF14DRAFT_1751697 [Spinellus fusiger]